MPVDKIKVVDARMGRGKSTAAIRYIEENKGDHPILYITPYLSEVERVCQCCDMEEPKQDDAFEEEDAQHEQHISKSVLLKKHLRDGDSIGATHSLFYLMDEEALALVREKHYGLIIDEAISVINKVNISKYDMDLLLSQLAEVGEDGRLTWLNEEYQGKLNGYKRMVQSNSIYLSAGELTSVLNPDLLHAFDEVYILTYRFKGSELNAYLNCFGFEYEIYGVGNGGECFVPGADKAPPMDLSKLLRFNNDYDYNKEGLKDFSLSKHWYETRSYDDPEIKELRRVMTNFLRRTRGKGSSKLRMWTCFAAHKDLLVPERGYCKDNFVPLNARATNMYRECTQLAYMVNRFESPAVIKFFGKYGVQLDRDEIALSEMLQWIWRSAIRDGKPVNLYIPSYRMRHLLIDWMNEVKKGTIANEE